MLIKIVFIKTLVQLPNLIKFIKIILLYNIMLQRLVQVDFGATTYFINKMIV